MYAVFCFLGGDALEIIVNGKKRDLSEELSVNSFIFSLGLNENSILVELNLKILKKYEWKDTIIQNGDSIEIISFMGGG